MTLCSFLTNKCIINAKLKLPTTIMMMKSQDPVIIIMTV